MEHSDIVEYLENSILDLKVEQSELLSSYALMIYNSSRRFNLTGLKTVYDIVEKLIIGSLAPLQGSDVPRGTSADIGSGSGIPGVPLSICYPGISITCIDSNSKKIDFINSVTDRLQLTGLNTINMRLEEAGRDKENREAYDTVFSRALGNIYIVAELASPMLKNGGILYIYSVKTVDELHSDFISQCRALMLEPVTVKEYGHSSGLLFRKSGYVPDTYPRKYPVINRTASKYKEFIHD